MNRITIKNNTIDVAVSVYVYLDKEHPDGDTLLTGTWVHLPKSSLNFFIQSVLMEVPLCRHD